MRETAALDRQQFAEMVDRGEPVVLRGLVAHWPAVQAGLSGEDALAAYLEARGTTATAGCVVGLPEINGRFFYKPDMTGFNFGRREATLSDLLGELRRQAGQDEPLALAMQSAPADRLMPGFAVENDMPLLPEAVRPRVWIGNRVRVATHYDSNENIACVVAGRRRFTLFPPDQIGNLYPGPLEKTPAGTPVSLVDVDHPDLARFPRYAEASRHALVADLAPGDALYIPYFWWHAVSSLDPVNMLVNYWWSGEGDDAPQLQAMLHALLAFRGLAPKRRAIWEGMFDHFVLHRHGDPAAHIAPAARGVLAEGGDPGRRDLLRHLSRSLAKQAEE